MLTVSQCNEFVRNPDINPITGRFITVGGATYNKLIKQCENKKKIKNDGISNEKKIKKLKEEKKLLEKNIDELKSEIVSLRSQIIKLGDNSLNNTLKEEQEKTLKYLFKIGVYDCNFKNWEIVNIIGEGFRSNVLAACDKNTGICDYVIKFTHKKEADFYQYLSQTGLTPKLFDIIECIDKYPNLVETNKYNIGIVIDRMNGDVGDLLYPIKVEFVAIISRILDIMYNLTYTYNLCHGDTKVNNFLYKIQGKFINAFISDFDRSYICEYMSEKNRRLYLEELVLLFFRSFMKPDKYGVKSGITYHKLNRNNRELIYKNERDFFSVVNNALLTDQRYNFRVSEKLNLIR